MDRQYRKMFDQALEQLGPEQTQVDALRSELARRCQDGPTKEVIPMKKRTKLLRNAIIAAAVAALLTATGAAVALGQREQVATVTGSNNDGVYKLDGHYYFKLDAGSEPIDITGQFSDTVPYVYDPGLPADEVGNLCQYVIGGSGDDIACVTAITHEGEDVFSGFQFAWKQGSRRNIGSCPIWWRTYCYSQEPLDIYHAMENIRDGFDNDLPVNKCYFRWALDSLTVDGQTSAVKLTVNGEERDVTAELADGGVYVLSVAGAERNTVYRDESMKPTPPDNWPESWTGKYDDPVYLQYVADVNAYDATRIYVPNAHDILAYRDGDEVRYAEFIYRPDGTLRYWMPWNCPSTADLGWLEGYAAQHGYELDWLIRNAYERGTDALYDLELQDWPEWLGSYSVRDIFPEAYEE